MGQIDLIFRINPSSQHTLIYIENYIYSYQKKKKKYYIYTT